MRLFKNRLEAAQQLANDVAFLKEERPIVLGLANTGVLIASVIAENLESPLDIMLIEKLGAPKHPQHIVGAVDEHGRISMIQSTARWHHCTSQQLIEPARAAFVPLSERRQKFRAILPELDVRGRLVLVVDHGVATGAKMLGAIASLRDRGASRVAVAAPAGAGKATWQLHEAADVVVIPHAPMHFEGVEKFYRDFSDVSDELVVAILQNWVNARPAQSAAGKTLAMRLHNSRKNVLTCELDLPPGLTRGSGPYPAVIFAHGFESDAKSPRSLPISQRLAKRGIIGVRMNFTGHGTAEGTVEDATEEQMLADLRSVYDAVRGLTEVDPSKIALNGAGTGAMIALRFAAKEPAVAAVVVRGPVCGNEAAVAHCVHAPTLLIHAEADTALSDTVRFLDKELHAKHRLLVIPQSSRLFSDPISRELMVSASVEWLEDHLMNIPVRASTTAGAAFPKQSTASSVPASMPNEPGS